MPWTCSRCAGSNAAEMRFCGHCGAPAESSAAGAEERRLVTVLFADLSGFTPLAERLDPELLVEVMEPLLSHMNDVVGRYGGRVFKYAGDAVLALFGVPIAHEDDAGRALLAAHDMRRGVAELAAPFGLELHIGVNTGHVVTGAGPGAEVDFGVLGDAVNTAQRLESVAPAGDIYVGALTRQLAAADFAFAEIGPVTVKGKTQPVSTWRLLGAAGSRDRQEPLFPTSISGRDQQLAVIDQRLRAAFGGRGQLVAVVGEPGIGKSQLLEGARTRAAGRFRSLRARCVSYGSTLPYRPYAELLYEVAGTGLDADVDKVAEAVGAEAGHLGIGEHAPYLAHLIGAEPRDRIPAAVRSSPEALRTAVQDAVVALLVALAGREPLVLAIEDLHWADAASLDLTRQLAQRARTCALTLLVTARPEGRSSVDDVLSQPDANITLIELDRLDHDSTRTVIENVLGGGTVDDALTDYVDESAAGNPLFVQEVVRSLLDTDRLALGAQGWELRPGGDVAVPASLEALLAARMDLLPTAAGQLLQIASVVGREIPLPLLADLAGLDSAAFEQALGVLFDRGFLAGRPGATEQRVTFHHALGQAVAYSRLLRRRRRELHRSVASAAIRRYGEGDDVLDVLAHHAYCGAMAETALRYLVRAADRSAHLYANREAIGYLDRALEIAGSTASSSVRPVDLLLHKADLHHLLGDDDAALTCYLAADEQEPVRSACGRSATLLRLGRYQDALAVVENAEARPAVSGDDAVALMHARARALSQTSGPSEAIRVLRAAAALVAGSGTQLEGSIAADLARELEMDAQPEEALPHAELAVRIFESLGELSGLANALRIFGGVLEEATGEDAPDDPRLEEAARVLDRAGAVASQIGHAEEAAAAQLNFGLVRQVQGRFEVALDAYDGALARFRASGIKGGVACVYCNIADLLNTTDRFAEARAAAEAGLAVAREIDNKYWMTGAMVSLANAALGEDDLEQCLRIAREAEAIARAADLAVRVDAAGRTIAAAEELTARRRASADGRPGPL